MTSPSKKTIDTLVSDIYGVLEKGSSVPTEVTDEFGRELAGILTDRLEEDRSKKRGLRLSALGQKCARRAWLENRYPDKMERLGGPTLLKFLYGDVLEALLLFLAKVSGHSVEHQQKEVSIEGIPGHIDSVIDGVLTDVKSASSRSFEKFRSGLTESSDSFGYLTQLGSYHQALTDDETVDPTRKAFLAVDKTLGTLALDVHKRSPVDFRQVARERIAALESDQIPPRAYQDEAFGKSGNRKLGTACSYCPAKRLCWPGLREFRYSTGPVYLTQVVKQPDVPES